MVDEEEIKEIEEHIDTLKKEKQKQVFRKKAKQTFWKILGFSKKGAKFTKEKVEKYSPKVEQAGKKAYKKTLKGIKYAGYAGAEGVEAVGEGALATTEAVGSILKKGPAPIQTFMYAWSRINKNIRFLIFILTLVAILFIPMGIFRFVGWAVAAAGMFLISLIYWVFVNFFNSIAYIFVTIINGVARIFMQLIIWVVNGITSIIGAPAWVAGQKLANNVLITYKEIATVPKLMTPVAPKWTGNQTLIEWIVRDIAGIKSFNLGFIWKPLGDRMATWCATAPWYQLAIVGLMPIVILIVGIVALYWKAKREYEI